MHTAQAKRSSQNPPRAPHAIEGIGARRRAPTATRAGSHKQRERTDWTGSGDERYLASVAVPALRAPRSPPRVLPRASIPLAAPHPWSRAISSLRRGSSARGPAIRISPGPQSATRSARTKRVSRLARTPQPSRCHDWPTRALALMRRQGRACAKGGSSLYPRLLEPPPARRVAAHLRAGARVGRYGSRGEPTPPRSVLAPRALPRDLGHR